MIHLPLPCIVKLMETTHQESKNKEITTGNLTQQTTDLVMVKKEFLMGPLLLSTPRDTRSNTQRPSLSKRLSRTTKPLHQTFQENPKISDKAKTIEEMISFTESKISSLEILGTPLDVSMESQPRERFSQITTSAKVSSPTAETS